MNRSFMRAVAVLCLVALACQSSCAWYLDISGGGDRPIYARNLNGGRVFGGTRLNVHALIRSHEAGDFSHSYGSRWCAAADLPFSLFLDALFFPMMLIVELYRAIPGTEPIPRLRCSRHGGY